MDHVAANSPLTPNIHFKQVEKKNSLNHSLVGLANADFQTSWPVDVGAAGERKAP